MNLPPQPGLSEPHLPVDLVDRHPQMLGTLIGRESPKVAQLKDLCLFGIAACQYAEGVVERDNQSRSLRRKNLVFFERHSGRCVSLSGPPGPRPIHQNLAHYPRCDAEKMSPAAEIGLAGTCQAHVSL